MIAFNGSYNVYFLLRINAFHHENYRLYNEIFEKNDAYLKSLS